ncbi:MAG: ScyD/ScyE family protein [Pyrinomonadaceae bacterium]
MILKIRTITVALSVVFALGFVAQAQTASTFTTGLTLPNKIINAGDNSMLVSEAGTPTPNTGRISLVDRANGARQTLISGLPSGVNNLGGAPAPSGPSGIILHGHTLYVTITSGDAVFNVGPGREEPSPNPPSSPLYCSILELTLPGNYETLTSPFAMTLPNQASLASGESVDLTNADGQTMSVRMVADLPNFRPEPRPGFPNNVRASNLFGVEYYKKQLYVVDASFNLLRKVDIASGDFETFATFAPKPNPLFPFGPPMVEAVPDSVHRVGNRLNITFLTGFPFGPGVAEVHQVSLKNGSQSTLIPGLRSAIDSLRVDNEGGSSSYYTLEFSANQLGNPPVPGVLKYFATADAAPVVVNSTMLFPTSMARDEESGDIFVTNIFLGRITRIQFGP